LAAIEWKLTSSLAQSLLVPKTGENLENGKLINTNIIRQRISRNFKVITKFRRFAATFMSSINAKGKGKNLFTLVEVQRSQYEA
jgi:hypothetical protein